MSDDEDMRRAIEASLQDAGPSSQRSQRQVYEGGDDDNDGDAEFQAELRRAMEASMKDSGGSSTQTQASSGSRANEAKVHTQSTTSFMSERTRLEKERLERQKRRRPPGLEDSPPPKRQASESSEASSSGSSNSRPVPVPVNSVVSEKAELFWEGELRQTANKHVTKSKDTRPVFRLSGLLGPTDEITFAIISSYALDLAWIYSFFDASNPVILVAQPDESGNSSLKQVLPNWIKTTPFLRNGRGCMHMKFMLLFYKSGRLRVVISTANLVEYDWRDMENTIWVQDLPSLPNQPHNPKSDDFAASFQRSLKALNVADALGVMIATDHPNIPLQEINDLGKRWDWSKVTAQLIPSIAGKHEGWPNVVHTGHTGLMMAIRRVRARAGPTRDVILECQGSSIGTYSTQWINEFYHSARGDSAQDWLDGPRTARAKLPYPSNLKIVFPSQQTVEESVLREPGGGTIFCRSNQWSGAKFPRELFHDSKSKRGGVLMHSKLILATFRSRPQMLGGTNNGKRRELVNTPDSEDEDPRFNKSASASISSSKKARADDRMDRVDEHVYGWAYIGSHNFTPSAWGTLSGTGFTPSLNIVNYEMGIVIPLRNAEQADQVACWERPPRKYNILRDKPWMQDEFFNNSNPGNGG